MTAFPESWTEFVKVGIKRERDTNEVQFDGLIEDITAMEMGEKDIEGMALLNGGRVVKQVPMTDESITFKLYPVSTRLDGTGIIQHMHPQTADDTSDPFAVLNTNLRQKHRIVLVWATSLPIAPTTAEAAILGGEYAERLIVANAYCTKVVPSFDDKIKSAEVTFKWAPFTKGAVSNVKYDSGTALTAVTATATNATA